ncbi:serine/threonine-protein kinase [Paraliomyxa miuraensis]|uniref:serine/threonine-protein kinase n=1 Tax=Paraliomyxa miuraensis TaxID=376150 RepID=UPI00225B8CC0|nr:serine/threonine-protein kinase [Paraliomyxa miuraensis]MCX4243968.1 serine/threonine-protein kinase [Paraliomyxa miuraensis]
MAENIQIEDALARLGHARAEGEPDDEYKRDIKARIFGSPRPPRRIGRFIDLGLLGHGAMGTVRRAYDERLAREVAIKLVRHGSAPRHHDRLLREAQALAQLSHPNVVQIYEVGELASEVFIAMELIEGVTLHEWQHEPRSWRECLEVYLQAGRGLAAAHATGLVHRDFKPTNCIRDEKGRVRVLDFGLARAVGFVDPSGPPPRDSEDLVTTVGASAGGSTASHGSSGSLLQAQLTERNAIVGTIAYMAPEQLGGRRVDAKSDQFSFCVALYEALYGLLPFSRDPRPVLMAMMGGHDQPPLVDPSSPKVPRALRRAVVRGLSGNPDARWPSMSALLEELERLGKRRSMTWASAGVASVLLMAGGWLASSSGERAPCRDAAGDTAELWSDERRARVEHALLLAGRGYGEQTWATVDEAIEHYARGLADQYVEACEATKVRSEEALPDLELRNACLDRQRGELEGTIATLADADDADDAVAQRAVDLVAALRLHEECADLDALRRAAEHEDSDAGMVAQVRERLGAARRSRVLGRYEDGLRIVEELSQFVPDLDGSLLAEIQVEEGTLRADLYEHQRAAELLTHAFQDALRNRANEIAVDAVVPLIYVVGIEQARPEEALTLGLMAEPLVEQEGATARARAEVLTVLGQVLITRGDHDAAQRKLEDAVDILGDAYGRDHILLARPLDSLATALREQGALQAAGGASQRALDIRIGRLGKNHPDVIHQHINLGAVFQSSEDDERALLHYRYALDLLRSTDAPARDVLAHVRTNLGALLAKHQQWEEAEPMLRLGIEDWVAVNGPRHPRVAKARLGLGRLLHRRGRDDEAVGELELALEIFEEQRPTPELARIMDSARESLDEARRAEGSTDQ